MGRLFDARGLHGDLLVYDSFGLVGTIEEITLTDGGETELLIATIGQDYDSGAWIKMEASLQNSGSILISHPDNHALDHRSTD
ncbi:MAG: hypothetical protein AAGI63_18535 [Planctomycetota bacterium]